MQKKVFIGLSAVACIVIVYFLLIGFLVSGGYRNYKKFCSEYIPQIEIYHSENLNYPESLFNLTKPKYSMRYKIEKCGYTKTKKGFSFFASEGLMGLAIYDSIIKKWIYD